VIVAERGGLRPEVWRKLDRELQQAIEEQARAGAERELAVLVVLTPTAMTAPAAGGAPQAAARWQAAFERRARPLIAELERLGARPVELFWINSSLTARLLPAAIAEIGGRDEVQQIQLLVERRMAPV
jgi:hypothetical protein